VRSRPWYASAVTSDTVQMTEPYIFAQLGTPGRTLSKRLQNSDTVVAIDMTLATLSEFLTKHKISNHGDVYLFSRTGEVIASSLDRQKEKHHMPVPELELTEQEKQFVAAQPTLKVSNELNWPPFDFRQAGQPNGYSIDIVKLITKMTGLKVSFTNGFSWPELLALYQSGEIDLLQSVIATDANRSLGLLGNSYAGLPYAIITRDNFGTLSHLAELNGKQLAIPAGWSTIPILRDRFPQIDIVEAESTLKALEMVLTGEATAALDNEAILRYLTRTYFLTGLQFHKEASLGEGELPETLHIVVPADRPQLRQLIDKAIAAIGEVQVQLSLLQMAGTRRAHQREPIQCRSQ
jgi:ABC-type amino acid transport substrate-binding protein